MAAAQAVEPHTKDRIVDAAIDLFSRQGYNATSLRQIAEAVGVQVGSLYNHLSSKEQLLFDIMHGVMVELIAFTEAEIDEAGEDPMARLMAFLRASIRFHATRQKETFIGNTELRGLSDEHRAAVVKLRDTYEGLLSKALVEARDAELVEVEDVPLATYAGLAMCSSVATWYRAEGRLSLDDLDTMLPHLFGPVAGAARGR